MQIIDGWLVGATHCPSPNYNARPANTPIDLVVIHNISLPPGQFGGGCIQQFFLNQLDSNQHPYFATIADLQVSAHVLIERDGGITQFVSFDDRAWHAGQSCFEERENCNDFSIGIELEGTDTEPYSSLQYQQLSLLLQALRHAYPAIDWQRLVGHSDIAPGRKTDPGPAFDWQRLKQLLC